MTALQKASAICTFIMCANAQDTVEVSHETVFDALDVVYEKLKVASGALCDVHEAMCNQGESKLA